MECDMCGVNRQQFRALIEGTELSVCRACLKYGKALGSLSPRPITIKQSTKQQKLQSEDEYAEYIDENYSNIIKQAREKLNLKQEELGKALNEKVSLIQNIEREKIKPSLALARKLEKYLKISIIRTYEEHPVEKSKKTAKYTIGDFIKLKDNQGSIKNK